LEDNAIRQLRYPVNLALLLVWGMVIGTLCRLLVTDKAFVGSAGTAFLYGGIVYYLFARQNIWYPVIIPILFQVPVAGFTALAWSYIESNRERQHIKKAFTYYLPNEVVEQLSNDASDIKADSKLVYGTCLCTDAKEYTTISEIMEPEELSSFMNRYYEILFEPIRNHGGVVSNVVGDSMLALWVTMNAEQASYGEAASAALDIVSAVNRFKPPANIKLWTRIGVHTGHIVLGNIGAIDHYEYRPVGDIVNTASRIEGLNKYLGTRILLSEEMHAQLDGFLTRRIGKFLLVGKSKPIVVYELMGRLSDSDQRQESRCMHFSEAYSAFRNQSWGEAIQGFNELIATFGEDGPSLFYTKLCKQYKTKHFGDVWDGMISMANK
jgi:adenylate cyclase